MGREWGAAAMSRVAQVRRRRGGDAAGDGARGVVPVGGGARVRTKLIDPREIRNVLLHSLERAYLSGVRRRRTPGGAALRYHALSPHLPPISWIDVRC